MVTEADRTAHQCFRLSSQTSTTIPGTQVIGSIGRDLIRVTDNLIGDIHCPAQRR